tara:strand:+ start:2692 stop:3054 length:363 start_codon:yes stop_codon:yes gene_type:complete
MPVDPKTGKKLPYNSKEEEYMAAAKNNMPAEEGPPMEEPPMEEPPMDGPPMDGPPMEEGASLPPVQLTQNALTELSDPANQEDRNRLLQAGIIEEVGGGAPMDAPMGAPMGAPPEASMGA